MTTEELNNLVNEMADAGDEQALIESYVEAIAYDYANIEVLVRAFAIAAPDPEERLQFIQTAAAEAGYV